MSAIRLAPSHTIFRLFLAGRHSAARALVFACLSACILAPVSAAEHPDVLFIAIDDLNTQISTYGFEAVQTPNLDALAGRGMLFTRAYCQYPMCNPSRTSVLTGLRPETTRVVSNSTLWRDQLPHAVTIPQYFSSHGYRTVSVGKLSHGPQNESAVGWDELINPNQGEAPPRKPLTPPTGPYPIAKREGRKMDRRLEPFVWGPTGLPDTNEVDYRIASRAIEVLQTRQEQPLFLAVGFIKPHLIWTAPDRFFAQYPADKVSLPNNPPDDLGDLPAGAKVEWLDDSRLLTPKMKREAIAAYRACCGFMDFCLGRVLDALRETGRDKNTVVIVWSDHGFLLGEHSMWGKSRLFEEACLMPLIVSTPDMKHAGARCERLVELVDLYPTLVELCGLPPVDHLEGTSLVPLLQDPDQPWKRAVFSMVVHGKTSGRSVRTDHWRYNEYGSPEEAELYDHRNDPSELVNLANEPSHTAMVAEMRKILEDGFRSSRPE